MKNKKLGKYYLISCISVLLASYYPLSMGVRVVADMIKNGAVNKENYPKYIIPYTPISVALIVGILIMPLCIKLFKRFAQLCGSLISTGMFFVVEFLFEKNVVVSDAETITLLEDWQMYMCRVPQDWELQERTVTVYRTETAVDILMGNYNPAFKLHFYIISLVLILAVLNCLYGFAQIIHKGEKKRVKALILQSVCTVVFLGLCILACFTAFWRDGNIRVSALSAILMAVYFILLGITIGVFTGSFLLEKRKLISVWVPAVVASVMTLIMYIGEMILLNGHLYKLGDGFLFSSIEGIVLAPVDLLIIILSGCITGVLFNCLVKSKKIKNGR